MRIEIIGAESSGVRGLCCFVETENRKILIDPGIALGYKRHNLLPHPVQIAEDEKDGPMTFSGPAPHGETNDILETVIMTRIEEDEVFVHAPDIQLLNDDTVSQIICWKPDIVLAGCPPIYLSRLSDDQIKRAWHNALRLCRAIDCVLLDHHLMRSREGLEWLKQLSLKTGKAVMCAADFMHRPRLLLEADRECLYEKMPVPDKWHEDYARGKVDGLVKSPFCSLNDHFGRN